MLLIIFHLSFSLLLAMADIRRITFLVINCILYFCIFSWLQNVLIFNTSTRPAHLFFSSLFATIFFPIPSTCFTFLNIKSFDPCIVDQSGLKIMPDVSMTVLTTRRIEQIVTSCS